MEVGAALEREKDRTYSWLSHTHSCNSWKNSEVAVGQNQWYHFGVGPPPILVYFSGDWDVHWGYKLLTHGQVGPKKSVSKLATSKGTQKPRSATQRTPEREQNFPLEEMDPVEWGL